MFQYRITERKAVWAIKHRTFVNNFAYETAEINIEVKHLQPLKFYQNDEVVVDLE